LGAGLFARYRDTEQSIKDLPRLKTEAQRLIDRSYAVYSRDYLSRKIVDERIMPLACPSVFAIPRIGGQMLTVVNLMRNGAHYDYFDSHNADVWRTKVVGISKTVHHEGFFAAHNDDEAAFARELGWDDRFIVEYNGNPNALISLYSNCFCYFGNRIHGAIAVAGAGGDAYCCSYDSRLDAVKMVGGTVCLPEDLRVDKKMERPTLFDRHDAHEKYIKILTEFKNA
jgi:hypothetical protein